MSLLNTFRKLKVVKLGSNLLSIIYSNRGSRTSIYVWTVFLVLWSTFKSGVSYFDLHLNQGSRTSICIWTGGIVLRLTFKSGVSYFDQHLNRGPRTSIYTWTEGLVSRSPFELGVLYFDLHLNRRSRTWIHIWTNPSAILYKTQTIDLYLPQMAVTRRFVCWLFFCWLWNFIEKFRKIIIMTAELQCLLVSTAHFSCY